MIQTIADRENEFEEDRNQNVNCEIEDNMHSAFAFDMMRTLYFGSY
ncbi:MAG: hypothetical protein K2N06_01200 [Oscillospiraceae bacterium]|nr:hypothetical protein [Oscillospiraceae bacterium]